MKYTHRIILALFAGVLLILSSGFAAGGDADAVRLVSAMRVDYSALLGMQFSAKQAFTNGQTTQKSLNCILALPHTTFTSIFSRFYQSSLSPAEIREAIAFYESPLGRKITAYGLAKLYQMMGGSSPEPMPVFSADEERDLMAFVNTGAGKKLFHDKIMEQPPMRQVLANKIKELIRSCGRS